MSAKGLPQQQDFICSDARDMLDDLQLAAELGKTLLERNKELEVSLKQHQNVIDDQVQEIEYLTKQTVALREVSDSRLKIYEQLEVSIQDLERANHRLVLDNSAGKKHIKSLTTTIESLETKCEELQSTIDDLRLQVDGLKRRNATAANNNALSATSHDSTRPNHVGHDESDGGPRNSCETRKENVKASPPKKTETATSSAEDEDMEQMSQLLAQLREVKAQSSKYQRRISELEEQLATVIQQNQSLENQVFQIHHHRDEHMKSMYDELNTLEEVRKGQMCSRCLRNVDSRTNDEDEIPEDDDSSMLEALMSSTPSIHHSSFSLEVQDVPMIKAESNPNMLYKDLVDKYEALLEVHRHPSRNQNNKPHEQQRNNCVSLQEELQMSGDFNGTAVKDTDDESGHGDSLKPDQEKMHNKARITFSQTPTDFSEAETSSSGFQDETSNKATQTEERPGSFLCTIADGEDCKFSIYDDASPISSRFRSKPEYQELFKEIFMVLKNTAETKPDDHSTPKVMPVKPMVRAESPVLMEMSRGIQDDDSQSMVSSTMSELSLSQNEPTTVIENIIQAQNQPIPLADPEPQQRHQPHGGDQRVLKPLIRQPLEYLSVEVRKRSSSRRKNKQADRSDSPMTHIIGSPKINYSSRPNSGRRRRDLRNNPQEVDSSWNGHTVQFWSSNRSNIASPTPSQGSGKFEFKPSLASQDLHKLKKLDLSYAEVLRNADASKKAPPARQRRKHHQT